MHFHFIFNSKKEYSTHWDSMENAKHFCVFDIHDIVGIQVPFSFFSKSKCKSQITRNSFVFMEIGEQKNCHVHDMRN